MPQWYFHIDTHMHTHINNSMLSHGLAGYWKGSFSAQLWWRENTRLQDVSSPTGSPGMSYLAMCTSCSTILSSDSSVFSARKIRQNRILCCHKSNAETKLLEVPPQDSVLHLSGSTNNLLHLHQKCNLQYLWQGIATEKSNLSFFSAISSINSICVDYKDLLDLFEGLIFFTRF